MSTKIRQWFGLTVSVFGKMSIKLFDNLKCCKLRQKYTSCLITRWQAKKLMKTDLMFLHSTVLTLNNRPLQHTITWYKIRRAGEQAHYYSRTGTLKQRPVKLDCLRSVAVRCMWCIYSRVESGCKCCPFTCCYVKFRGDRDRVRHVLDAVVAVVFIKVPVLNSGDEDSGKLNVSCGKHLVIQNTYGKSETDRINEGNYGR